MAETSQTKTKQKYILRMSDLDVEILLKVLGDTLNRRAERSGGDAPAVRYLIDRIYRAIGVRL
jgi:hypothetical protein